MRDITYSTNGWAWLRPNHLYKSVPTSAIIKEWRFEKYQKNCKKGCWLSSHFVEQLLRLNNFLWTAVKISSSLKFNCDSECEQTWVTSITNVVLSIKFFFYIHLFSQENPFLWSLTLWMKTFFRRKVDFCFNQVSTL